MPKGKKRLQFEKGGGKEKVQRKIPKALSDIGASFMARSFKKRPRTEMTRAGKEHSGGAFHL